MTIKSTVRGSHALRTQGATGLGDSILVSGEYQPGHAGLLSLDSDERHPPPAWQAGIMLAEAGDGNFDGQCHCSNTSRATGVARR